MKIYVIEKNIVDVSVDALLTAIRPNTMPLGRVDCAIGLCAKDQFHRQAFNALSNEPEQKVVIARGGQHHERKFNHVIFVVDDTREPLEDIVSRGLDAAAAAGFRTVSLPAIRFRETQEPSEHAYIIKSIIEAILGHSSGHKEPLREVSVVTYNDAKLADEFRQRIADASSHL